MSSFRTPAITALIAIAIALLYSTQPSTMTTTETNTTLPWADGPCPLIHTPQFETKRDDIWSKGATHMALLHNAVLRGFNSIYLQAPHVKPEDYKDFIGYSTAWYRLVKTHHDDEEAELFPKVEAVLNEKGIWDETILEHDSFLAGLSAFKTYLSTLPDPTSFSGTELVAIMDTFREPLTHHFHSEIQTIAALNTHASAPAPGSAGADSAGQTFKTWGKKTLTKAGLTDVVPFVLLNLDRGFEGGLWAGWPPMPAPVRWGLVNVVGSWNWGWWRFSSCDSAGDPRPLYALEHAVLRQH